jgi:tetratricopeptide (TPR) repeat protein
MFALATTAIVLLCVQGRLCFIRTEGSSCIRWFGGLTFSLALSGLLLALLLLAGTLVVSPELGIVMVEGPLARLGGRVLLLAVAVMGGMGWETARLRVGWPARRRSLLATAAVIGLLAASRWLPIETGDTEGPPVYAYDLRWPPLAIWLGICAAGSILTLLRSGSRLSRACLISIFVAGLALWALLPPPLYDPGSEILWKGCLLAVGPLSVSVVIWLLFRWLNWASRPAPRRLRLCLIAPLVSVSAISSLPWFLRVRWPRIGDWLESPGISWVLWVDRVSPWVARLGWMALLSVVVARALYVTWHAAAGEGQERPKPTVAQLVLSLALVAIALSLVDLFYCYSYDLWNVDLSRTAPIVLAASFIVAWLLLAEMVGSGLFGAISRLVVAAENEAPQSPMRRTWGIIRGRVVPAAGAVAGWLAGFLSVSSVPAALVKTLLGLALLIALSEMPNAGKTIIEPFKIVSLRDRELRNETEKDREQAQRERDQREQALGRAVADRLLNMLGQLRQELQPDIIIVQPTQTGSPDGQEGTSGTKDKAKPGAKTKPSTFVISSVGASGIDAAVAKSSDIEVGSVKIPLGVLVSPIQMPMRALLKVRLISGTLHEDGRGYTLLAWSNAGESWRVTLTREQLAADHSNKPAGSTGLTINDAIRRLADELAFRIMGDEPVLVATGLALSWKAPQPFREGLAAWDGYESERHDDILGRAIESFRRASRQDPRFALAYYRLGLALQEDGQPDAAAEALRTAVRINPRFVPGRLGLATALFSDLSADAEGRQAQLNEARRLWHQVLRSPPGAVTLANQAFANAGVCLDALTLGEYERAYLYCKRAERLYAGQATTDPNETRARAYVLNALGDLHSYRERDSGTLIVATDWLCLDDLPFEGDAQDQVGQGRERELRHELDAGNVSAELRAELVRTGAGVSKKGPLVVSIRKAGHKWLVIDKTTHTHVFISRKGESLRVRERKLPVGPHMRHALRYYGQARLLAPNDPGVRCNAALAAYTLGNPAVMEALQNDTSTRMALADSHLERTDNDPVYFALAVDEYEAAIKLSPHSIDALNRYAWMSAMWWFEGRKVSPSGPDLGAAEARAREAVRLARNRLGAAESRRTRVSERTEDRETGAVVLLAQTHDTLGAVLLARDHLDKAIPEFEEAARHAPQHARFDEIRWHLAQVYCAASNRAGPAGTGGPARRQTGKNLFEQISKRQEGRETKEKALLRPLWVEIDRDCNSGQSR